MTHITVTIGNKRSGIVINELRGTLRGKKRRITGPEVAERVRERLRERFTR